MIIREKCSYPCFRKESRILWSPPEREVIKEFLAFARNPEFFGVPDFIGGGLIKKFLRFHRRNPYFPATQ